MNNEDPITLSRYLREQFGWDYLGNHKHKYLIEWVEAIETERDRALLDSNRLRLENESLQAKNLELASELLQKREQVDVLKTACDAMRTLLDKKNG